jgi:peptide/nickel transport system substrate-binding protein
LFNSSIISQAFAEKIGVENLVTQAMGTGPFGLKEWKKAEYTLLAKNAYYWEEGLPYLDELKFTVVPDNNNEVLQLQGGEIDGIVGQGDVPFNRIEELKNDPNLQVINSVSTYNNFIVINTRDAPRNDVKARQALNYATDKETLIQTILFGNGEVSNSFMPNGALYWNPDQEGYPFDLDKAKQLMSESATPDGFKLEFQINSGDSQQQQIASALKNMWAGIGVELDILPLEQTIFRDNYRQNKFESRLSGWTNDIIDPDELVGYAILPEATENYHTGWTDQQAIDLAHQGQTELDDAKRREIYYQIQQIHMEAAPFVYLWVVPYVDALHKKVKGFFHNPMGHYNFTNTYIEE